MYRKFVYPFKKYKRNPYDFFGRPKRKRDPLVFYCIFLPKAIRLSKFNPQRRHGGGSTHLLPKCGRSMSKTQSKNLEFLQRVVINFLLKRKPSRGVWTLFVGRITSFTMSGQ